MKQIELGKYIQIWVCVNERQASKIHTVEGSSQNALPSCTLQRGSLVFRKLQKEASFWSARLKTPIWVNRSFCQGFCSAEGVTVTIEPIQKRYQAVTEETVDELLRNAFSA
jgi:hypothetical protein